MDDEIKHPQISMLSLGCALGRGGQKINPERKGSHVEFVQHCDLGCGGLLGRCL